MFPPPSTFLLQDFVPSFDIVPASSKTHPRFVRLCDHGIDWLQERGAGDQRTFVWHMYSLSEAAVEPHFCVEELSRRTLNQLPRTDIRKLCRRRKACRHSTVYLRYERASSERSSWEAHGCILRWLVKSRPRKETSFVRDSCRGFYYEHEEEPG